MDATSLLHGGNFRKHIFNTRDSDSRIKRWAANLENYVVNSGSFIKRTVCCWFVSRITQKLPNGFPENLDGGCVSAWIRPRHLFGADLAERKFLPFFKMAR